MTETTTQVERVALAIEGVIEENNDLMTDWYEGGGWKNIRELAGKSATAAIKAMSDAEPVAWMYEREDGSRDLLLDCNGEYARRLLELGATETPLYAAPQPHTAPIPNEQGRDEVERLIGALARQCDNMAFVLNKATLPDQWYCKFSNELGEDRAALSPPLS